jgi:hypothetical protein
MVPRLPKDRDSHDDWDGAGSFREDDCDEGCNETNLLTICDCRPHWGQTSSWPTRTTRAAMELSLPIAEATIRRSQRGSPALWRLLKQIAVKRDLVCRWLALISNALQMIPETTHQRTHQSTHQAGESHRHHSTPCPFVTAPILPCRAQASCAPRASSARGRLLPPLRWYYSRGSPDLLTKALIARCDHEQNGRQLPSDSGRMSEIPG